MRSTKKAFTLVELIVVIVILAILGTIAFISLQGHSAEARNAKRTSDLGNIRTAIETQSSQGTSLLSFVTTVANNKLPTANLKLSGTGLTATEYSDNYDVGTPNYTALNMIEDDFKDSNDKPYVVAVTTKIGGAYQIAASLEDGAGDYIAEVTGTYNPRGVTAFSTTADNVDSIDVANNQVVLTSDAANYFKRGDTITGTATTTVTKVSTDGITLTVADASGLTITDQLELAVAETAGLIDATTTGASGTPVVDGAVGSANVPY